MVLVEEISFEGSAAKNEDESDDENTRCSEGFSRCVTRSMTASLNERRLFTSPTLQITNIESATNCSRNNNVIKRERTKRSRCNSTRSRRFRSSKKRKCNSATLTEDCVSEIELTDLSEEVLIAILEHVSAPGLINMSKTSWLFHRICHTDTLWRHRCRVRIYFYISLLSFIAQ